MARPKTPPNEQLSHCIMLRLTQTQYDLIRTLADYMKIPLAECCRRLITHGKIELKYSISVDIPEVREVARLMANATGNLNQIAKYFNTGGIRSKEVTEKINEAIEVIFSARSLLEKISESGYGDLKTFCK